MRPWAALAIVVILTLRVGFASAQSGSYEDGIADWGTLQAWFQTQTGDGRAGADYWAGNRSKAGHKTCGDAADTFSGDRSSFAAGCEEAKRHLDPIDVKRLSDRQYRVGFNDAATELPISPPSGPRAGDVVPAPPPSPASAAADGSSDASFKCRDPKTDFQYSRSFPCARGDTILASPAGYPKMGCSPDTYWRPGVGCVPNGIPAPRGAGASRQAPLEPRAPPTDDRVEKVVEWVEGVEADAGLAPPWYAPRPPYKSQESAESAAAMMYSVVEKWAEAAMTSSGGNPAQVYFSSAMISGAIAQLYWRNALTAYEYHDPTKMREDAATAHSNSEEAMGWLNKSQENMKQIENNH